MAKTKKTSRKSSKKNLSLWQKLPYKPAVFSLLFAMVGVAFLIFTHAQTPSASVTGADYFGIAPDGGIGYYGKADVDKIMDVVKESGAKWIRVPFEWSQLQPTSPTAYNWTITDGIMQSANERGIKVLVVLWTTPAWARPTGTDMYAPPTNPTDFANFGKAVASRYASQGLHHYEIWNEPNQSYFFKPKPDAVKYTQLLKAAYSAVKQADPSAIVMGPATTTGADTTDGTQISPMTFLQTIYNQGGKDYMDAVSYHPYPNGYPVSTSPNWTAWGQMLNSSPSVRSVMVANGDSAKKIWATEAGYHTGSAAYAVSETQQAQYLKETYALWTSYDWAGPMFWYEHKDQGTNLSDKEANFGLLRYDWTKKPAFAAYQQALADWLAKSQTTSSPSPAPSVSLKGVSDQQIVSNSITLQALPSDVTPASVDFYIDGKLQNSEKSSGPWCLLSHTITGECQQYDTHQLANGSHTFKATVNYSGGSVSNSVVAQVQNSTTASTSGTSGSGLSSVSNGTGLPATYFNNMDFTGRTAMRTDATINFNWGSAGPIKKIGGDSFSVRWIGKIMPRSSETYTFRTVSDDGVRVWINDRLIIDNWSDHSATSNSGSIALSANIKYNIKVEYYENIYDALVQLYWKSALLSESIVPQSQLFAN